MSTRSAWLLRMAVRGAEASVIEVLRLNVGGYVRKIVIRQR